ncbi:hypothetical protein Cgig2_002379 [Carnegiea gigantea]|uniref:Neprosin PEP catalytic domain-containing protein n=1 Tax=Carnegiea gigantea TaxID=171969 RepID=A0A9Q1QNZ4_9CARY|nr:hypothetical protein Cgig2_002379 [Carnegiea gigantea]
MTTLLQITLELQVKNVGVHGNLNVWGPEVAAHQFSAAEIYVASADGSLTNDIIAGWIKDSGKSTGCFNMVCPGFVQVSRRIPIGMILHPLSTYGGEQYEISLSLIQDDVTGNWWFQVMGENVGYYPKELFTTLANGAIRSGWGGEIYSSVIEASPAMGSGHFPDEGFGKACFIRQMKLLDPSYSAIYPGNSTLWQYVSKPQCYNVAYAGEYGGDSGHTMYFGGPPGCQPWED